MYDLTPYGGSRRSRNHRIAAVESFQPPYVYGDYVGSYSGYGNFRGGLFDWSLEYNNVEEATRSHVAAKSEWEKAKEKFDEAKKKLEECEKKLKDSEEKLREAKREVRYG
ncbi:hypothetical protein NX059_002986 [Plenodomus lindquistii]|nr:hypothetical protein NX059_002986 [Plenodomus lindquistii]